MADYNELIKELDVHERIGRYMESIKGTLPDSERAQFERDVISEFQPLE